MLTGRALSGLLVRCARRDFLAVLEWPGATAEPIERASELLESGEEEMRRFGRALNDCTNE
jgi:hypothetical protein